MHRLVVTRRFFSKLFDLLPCFGPQFVEAVAGALTDRQQHWLGGFDILVELLTLSQKGSVLVRSCLGRMIGLEKVYEVVELESGQFQKNFLAFAALASVAAMKGPTLDALWKHQRLNGLPELATVLYNGIRWEGRYQLICRAFELETAILGNNDLLTLDVVWQQLLFVPDYLSRDHFERLKAF